MKVPSSLAIAAAFAASSVAALDAKFYGINYDTRTTIDGGCKDFLTIAEDFNVLRRVTDYVRIYGMDFNCSKSVLEAARDNALKVWLGLWSEVKSTDAVDSFPSQYDALKRLVSDESFKSDKILGIQVSSEALYRYYVKGPGNKTGSSDRHGINTVLGHLKTVRSHLRDHNLTFPVVISDIMDMYTKFPELYDEVDVVAVNQFSFWENKAAEEGAHFTFKRFQEQETRAKRAGKLILLHEAGWSTAGEHPIVTEASPRAQGVFTQDFLTLAARQNLNAFYFAAFDLPFNPTDIERNFGIHYANRELKRWVEEVHVGPPLEAVRLRAGDNVIKAHRYWNADDDSVNENFGRVYAAKASVELESVLGIFERERHADLEYVGNNNTQTLGTSPCSNVTNDQKWSFVNGYIVSQNDAKFCIDVDVHGSCQTTPNGNLVVKMSPCNVTEEPTKPNYMYQAAHEPLEIGIKTDGGVLTELSGKVTWQTNRRTDSHQWFYDPVTRSIKNRASLLCLDASKRMTGGDVLLRQCNAANVNQKWVLNDITGQIHHATHFGFCLGAPDDVDGLVYLLWCDKNDANQQWNIKPIRLKT
ncbi:hypothetical protein H257_07227 [Aphanomyces astaci]|uniref:glucan endo-1,3-beta-D-glucosidase n=1 Tax=Aphanomyces astaci TaxID=112090 RepID=W4GK46_APHAT|nr:hypothetical protein H257_07227 [Aphanomyces astaci]ETV80045.1 hypothetical protein H257_07227 [Aphanomyces astaci]|eukprot:XP_009830981.1 hypothetical protein H257_07227 [Aphanomyces astaci]